jgi:hypothetical protein
VQSLVDIELIMTTFPSVIRKAIQAGGLATQV